MKSVYERELEAKREWLEFSCDCIWWNAVKRICEYPLKDYDVCLCKKCPDYEPEV